MTRFLNGLLLCITFTCYISHGVAYDTKAAREEVDFYESLKHRNHGDPSILREKRSEPAGNNGVYESEVKVLGRVEDAERRTRVERASGDNDFSESPVDPQGSYQYPSKSNIEDSIREIGTVEDEDSSPKETINILSDPSSSRQRESDLGTGIQVESEEKLAEDDENEYEEPSSPQTVEGDISLTTRSDTMEEALWPSGTYGLPRPLSGCPDSSGFIWRTGVRFYDTEDDGTENHQSEIFHMAGDVTEDGITLEFCMKTKDVGRRSWPSGKYCIYKKGPMCPDGLRSGFVFFDDETLDNKNYHDGILPEGTYTDKTKMAFCCSTKGNVTSQISLPTDKPFYLFPHASSTCQNVRKMKSTLEFVKFDEEDKGVIEKSAGGFYPFGIDPREKDHTINLCYYEPEDGIDGDTLHLESGVSNSQKMAHSQKVITEFMKDNNDESEEEIAKEEEDVMPRTRIANFKKYPNMRTSTYHAIVIATGFVLTTIAILAAALLVISYFTKKWTKDLKKPIRKSPPKLKKEHKKEAITPAENTESPDQQEEEDIQEETPDAAFVEDELAQDRESELVETEQEDEELVEDQFLPSDSQLKSGLEFLFLKQQRQKWMERHKRRK